MLCRLFFFFLNEEAAAEKRFEGRWEPERDQREEIARAILPLQIRYERNAHKNYHMHVKK